MRDSSYRESISTPGGIVALNIKSEATDRLARHLAELTGESLTEAVTVALEERLSRIEGRRGRPSLAHEIERIQARVGEIPLLDPRSDEELLGYDDVGLPR